MFLDTSGLLCLLDRRDARRQRAVELYGQAPIRITHGYVLSELIALANVRKLPIQTALSLVQSLIVRPEVLVIWPDERLTARSIILLQSRIDAGYSLCDAASFVIMRDSKITAALTTDVHFEREGFERLLV
jgi:uncharacterized protein